MGKSLKKFDGYDGDSSSKDKPSDIIDAHPLHPIMRGIVLKNSNIPLPILKNPVSMDDLVCNVSYSSSTEFDPHATTLGRPKHKDQLNPYADYDVRVTENVVEP